MEYRGYDSAGFACIAPSQELLCLKAPGHLENLVSQLEAHPIDGHLGIGHIRWSTHGISSSENAHPQLDCHKRLSVAHNGIIENHLKIRQALIAQGHIFRSDTDTEVVAHLLESLIEEHTTLKDACIALVGQLEGAYALACISQNFPDQMVILRKGSPLCIGLGDNQLFAASDIYAFAGLAHHCIFMPDKSFAILESGTVKLYDFEGTLLNAPVQPINMHWADAHRDGHQHFMLKEIYEQKTAIANTLTSLRSLRSMLWQQLGIDSLAATGIKAIYLIGAGTSWHAARIAQFYFEYISKIPTHIKLASEFRYMPFFPEQDALYIFISQSGETADTLEAMRLVNQHNLPTIALSNVAESSAVREARGFMLTQAGQEIAVASTKAFSTQLVALFWLANHLAYEKKLIDSAALALAEQDILIAAQVLEEVIDANKQQIIQELAPYYAHYSRYIFLGRHLSYPFAMEAALKLKEISYIFTQCYPAGELKHGPIALIDAETPVVIFSSLDELIYQKLLSNAQEVKARKGHLLIFAFEGQEELLALADNAFVIPHVNPFLGPLAMTGLMQFFVYQIACVLNRPIDKPRNLAKSVTVE